MFRRLVRLIIRAKWVIIAFWILAAGIIYFTAPNLSDVAKGDQASFLPSNAAPVEANRLTRELFSNKGGRSSLVLVISRESGLTQKDVDYAKEVENYVNSNKDNYNALEVLSPFSNKELVNQMISKNKTVALINISLSSPTYTDATNSTVMGIKDIVKTDAHLRNESVPALPDGLEVYVTGDAAISQEENDNVNKSMDLTIKITIFLVIAILIVIYRSPVAPLLPLFTIGISFLISRGIIALLANVGFKISTFTETFLVAVLFGAGTDYCLLIISRFKEERSSGKSVNEALMDSIPNTGIAIISSGGTVIIGFLFMIFARFGLFNSTGPSVAIGVAITLIAVMTLIPSIIAIIGDKLFWPAKGVFERTADKRASVWVKIAASVTTKPMRYLLIGTAILIPFIIMATKINLSYDQLKEMPSNSGSVIGYELMKKNFSQGEMLPVQVVMKTSQNMWDGQSLKDLDILADNISKVDNIAKVRTASRPLGEKMTEMSLPKQISMLTDGLELIKNGIDPVKSGLFDMQTGINSIASGISGGGKDLGTLSNAAGQSAEGISKARSGMNGLEKGTGDAVNGLNEIGGGLNSLVDGISQSEQALKRTEEVLSDSVIKLEQIMITHKEISNDKDVQTAYYSLKLVSESIKEISGGIELIRANLESSAGGVADISNGLSGIKGGITASSNALKQIQQGLEAIKEGQAKADRGLKTASASLVKISEGVDPVKDALDNMKSGLEDIGTAAQTYSTDSRVLDDVFFLPPGAFDKAPELKRAMDNYISSDGKGVIIDIVLSIPPYTNMALDTIKDIKQAISFTIRGTSLENAEFYIGGATSAFSEVRQLTSRDLKVVMIFVMSGIFLVLVFLLRSLIAPLYLIVTILLSFISTMGISYLFFQVILGYDGLHWSVPFFAFCVLVALGVDYNIFLMSRVKEEYKAGDTRGSIARALASTGGIITSCGIIMAGTFGAMLVSPVRPILEVGFAATTGLLIDTFIIRCLIVPAIAVKVGELNWWPGRRVKIIPYENEKVNDSLRH